MLICIYEILIILEQYTVLMLLLNILCFALHRITLPNMLTNDQMFDRFILSPLTFAWTWDGHKFENMRSITMVFFPIKITITNRITVQRKSNRIKFTCTDAFCYHFDLDIHNNLIETNLTSDNVHLLYKQTDRTSYPQIVVTRCLLIQFYRFWTLVLYVYSVIYRVYELRY